MAGKSEIHHEFVGLHSANSFVGHNSSPRSVMYQGHWSQRPGLVRYDPKILKTGTEFELGKYINDVRVDNDCTIRGVVPRYSFMNASNSELYPEYCVLVEYEKVVQGVSKLVLDVIECPNIRSNHTKFGFELFKSKTFKEASIGDSLRKDTVLCETASLDKDGSYKYGLNANIALTSHPGVSEDGAVISESFAERIGIVFTEKRIINISKSTIPLNLYGDKANYKVLPNIGEKVRPDGLLFSTRKKNDFFNPGDLTDEALMTPNYLFDEHTYVKPNSTIVDIKVIKGNYRRAEFPAVVVAQLEYYSYYLIMFYRSLREQVEAISQERKTMYSSSSTYDLSPRLHRLLVEAEYMISSTDLKSKIKLLYRKLPIEEYRVEITTKCITIPDRGFKLTDQHGGKCVICRVVPDNDMPMDVAGNKADIMVEDGSTIARMNIGRLYESYLGAYCRDNHARMMTALRGRYGIPYPASIVPALSEDGIEYVLRYLTDMYALISDEMLGFINNLTPDQRVAHAIEVIEEGIFLFYPPDNSRNSVDVINGIQRTEYKPVYGPVTYKDDIGRRVTTKCNIRVGVMYIMVLEKTADSYMAVSSAKLNNFGFPAKVSSGNKHRTPHALTPAKTLGETEIRIMSAYMPEEAVAELVDSVANPYTHKLIVKNILESDSPMKIPDIDRNANPLGNSKALMILKHISNSGGFNFGFVKEKNSA